MPSVLDTDWNTPPTPEELDPWAAPPTEGELAETDIQKILLRQAQEARASGDPTRLAAVHQLLAWNNSREIEAAKQAEADKMGPMDRALASFAGNARHGLKQAGNFGLHAAELGMQLSDPAGGALAPRLVPQSGALSDEAILDESKDLGRLTKGHFLSGAVPGFVGATVPQLPFAVAGPPAGGLLRQGATLLGRGGLQGAIFSDPGQREYAAAFGAALNTAPLFGKGAERTATGFFRPESIRNPAVLQSRPENAGEFLWNAGYADDLTTGATNPHTFMRNIEHAAARIPLVGKLVQKRQEEMKRNILMPEIEAWTNPHPVPGVPPTPIPRNAGTQPWFNEIAERSSQGYESFANQPTQHWTAQQRRFVPLKDLPLGYSAADGIRAAQRAFALGQQHGMSEPAVRDAVRRFQGILMPLQQGQVTWGQMQTMRSNLRAAVSELRLSENPDQRATAAMLDYLEKNLTAAMHKPLSHAQQIGLRDLDRAYSAQSLTQEGLRTQTKAKGAAPNPATPDPYPLRRALEGRITDRAITTGKSRGGPMAQWQQDFVQNADAAMSAPLPDPAAGPIPYTHQQDPLAFLSAAVLGLPIAGAYTKVGQKFLKGLYPEQQALARALASSTGQAAKRAGYAIPPLLIAAENMPEEP